ncbi:G-PROTEIN-RECEP-F1-2 domain-containing protein [Aphelenchoides besseyi]|nr:G-PROTEIN-RECEP-F1-2 domain-containing protein [Aphelenchoides besseyi]
MAIPTDWVAPLDDQDKLRVLCTDNNHFDVMRGKQSPLLNNLVRHKTLCDKSWESKPLTQRYDGLIWFMTSLGFCDINRYTIDSAKIGIEYTRDFQIEFLQAAFALVCHKTDDIGRYHLTAYADIFRLIYEKENENRFIICNKALMSYQDMYKRCHVEYTIETTPYSLDFIRNRCITQSGRIKVIRPRSFYSRFSRGCQSYGEFLAASNAASLSLGQSLANDTVFMNIQSAFLKNVIVSYSKLPQVVLKTRLLLQHFPLAAIKVAKTLENAAKCKQHESSNFVFDDAGNTVPVDATNQPVDVNGLNCAQTEIAFYENLHPIMYTHFQELGSRSLLGLKIELILLVGVGVNTIVLSVLLMQTRKKLSTATILFIFNVLFSNVLFVASFVCLFLGLFIDLPITGDLHETPSNVPLDVAETLQTHLIQPNEFLKHLAQETLYSLAQNGSLLGLTHLLVLVLVVINRSMSGEAIRLSRRCVIAVFSCVWIFLIVTHVVFSALQYSAINSLDQFFLSGVSGPGSLKCDHKLLSDYVEMGGTCDRVAIFHQFGVYLLRGHTLFTLTFLVASIIVFFGYNVRLQHDILLTGLRERSPHRRRETLFNTLLLSLGAFFISVSCQSYIEIAVFWADDRAGIARLATFYQWARLAAFVDPLFNPILIGLRTPSIRRRLRLYLFVALGMLGSMFCPWRPWHRKRKATRSKRRTTLTGPESHPINRRPGNESEGNNSESSFKVFCAQHVRFIRHSFLRRSRNSSHLNHSRSVV